MRGHEDERSMRIAIDIVRLKGSDPSTQPLGCVIVLDGKAIAAERNQTHELPVATARRKVGNPPRRRGHR